jgi:glutaminase A
LTETTARAVEPGIRIADALERAIAVGRAYRGGQVTTRIPALASADPAALGIAVAPLGAVPRAAGDADAPFSIQSISKLFGFALLLSLDGMRAWQRVRWQASASRYDSLTELEAADGYPRNPFVNAGAMLVTDRLMTLRGSPAAEITELLRTESGSGDIGPDDEVRRSEAANGHRNAALAHFLASYRLLENDVEAVLHEYYGQCSIRATCRDLATAAAFLANDGVTAAGRRLLTPEATRTLNAVMLTSGTYDGASDFAFRVGLPAKSGIGGGIVAVMPGRAGLCVWGPRLDRHGTSAAGVAALQEFCSITGWSVFSAGRTAA